VSARHTIKRTRNKVGVAQPKTDWARLRAMTDRDIERAVREDPDAAPILDAQWFRKAKLVMPPDRKRRMPISLRVESEVLDWFKAQGGQYQSRMHAVLKAFVEAHQQVRR
jgi:uncharacterized protein (DUF4415 family)